jgi:hypothetical protein
MKFKITIKSASTVLGVIHGHDLKFNLDDPVHKASLARTVRDVEEGIERLTGYRCHVETIADE